METLKSLGSAFKSVVDTCFLIGKGLAGKVSTIDLVDYYDYSTHTIITKTIEYIRICNGKLGGSLVASFKGVLSQRIDEILPHIQELQNDIYPLYKSKNEYNKLHIGGVCRINTVIIEENLSHKYNITMVVMNPKNVNSTWYNHLEHRLPVGQSYNIQQRDKLWGVGTTMGVIFHALPIFQWPEQNLYISVETTLFYKSFQLQFHVTQSLEEMKEFIKLRYLATRIEITNNLDDTIYELIEKCEHIITPYTKEPSIIELNHRFPIHKNTSIPKNRRASSAGLTPQKNKQDGGKKPKKTRKQKHSRSNRNNKN